MPGLPPDLDDTIRRALQEDIGAGDITTESVVPDGTSARGRFVAKEEGILAGLGVARRVFGILGGLTHWNEAADDGGALVPGMGFVSIEGDARTILTGERVALNFLTHLSGIATLTGHFVRACLGTRSKILCTRKTLPGLRALERYAVEVGGGVLHRAGLNDAVLIKDNHVAIAGGVPEAIRRARQHTSLPIEIEVDTLEQLGEALDSGADRVLLDNPATDSVKRALELIEAMESEVELEVSGGMTIEKVREVAGLGPLLISVGRITHSAPALDISLDFDPM